MLILGEMFVWLRICIWSIHKNRRKQEGLYSTSFAGHQKMKASCYWDFCLLSRLCLAVILRQKEKRRKKCDRIRMDTQNVKNWVDLKPSSWNNICHFFLSWKWVLLRTWAFFTLVLISAITSSKLSGAIWFSQLFCPTLSHLQSKTCQCSIRLSSLNINPFPNAEQWMHKKLASLEFWVLGRFIWFYFYINNGISLWCHEPLKSGDKSRNHSFWFSRRIEKCNSVLRAHSAASELSLQHHFQNSHPIQSRHCFCLLFLSLLSTFCPQLHVEAVSSHFICLVLGFWPPFAAPSTDDAPWWPGGVGLHLEKQMEWGVAYQCWALSLWILQLFTFLDPFCQLLSAWGWWEAAPKLHYQGC